jgi:hypothetical protein
LVNATLVLKAPWLRRVLRLAEQIVYPIRPPDWQIVRIEKYESDEIPLASVAETLEGMGAYPRVLFVSVASKGLTGLKCQRVRKNEKHRLKMKELLQQIEGLFQG